MYDCCWRQLLVVVWNFTIQNIKINDFFYFSSQFCTALSAKWRKVNFSNVFCNEVLRGCPKLKSRFINSKVRSVPILISKEKTCKQRSIKITCLFQRPTEPQWPTSASKSWRRWKTKPSISICVLIFVLNHLNLQLWPPLTCTEQQFLVYIGNNFV